MFCVYDFDIFKTLIKNASDSKSHYELIGYHKEEDKRFYFDYVLFSSAGTFWFQSTLDKIASANAITFIHKYLTLESCYLYRKDMSIRYRQK